MRGVAKCPLCRDLTLEVVVKEDGQLLIYCADCNARFTLAHEGQYTDWVRSHVSRR